MTTLKWNKMGLLFEPNKFNIGDWMHEFAQAPCTLEFNDFIRVYFSCRSKPNEKNQYTSYAAYVDLCKNNLFKVLDIAKNPILKLGKRGTFDEFGTYPISVLREGKKIVAYYGGWTRCESVPFDVSIGYAESVDDGKNFEKLGDGPILGHSLEEPFIISGPKIRKYNDKWYLFYIAGKKWIQVDGKQEPIYKIRLATSDNGLTWNKLNKDIIADLIGQDEAQASPDVIFINNKYHMFFCYRHATDYKQNKDKSYKIGYASSENLVDWVRNDSKAGIIISDSGWDSEMISYPHLFQLNGKLFMLYLGNEFGKYGFGIAELEEKELR